MRKHNVIVIIVAIAMGGGAAYLARSWLQNECLSRLSPTRSYCDRGGGPWELSPNLGDGGDQAAGA
jgi:hypothetical protein